MKLRLFFSVVFFSFSILFDCGIVSKSHKEDLISRRTQGVNLFRSTTENMENVEERFPVDPNQGVWASLPTQDTHWLTLPEDCQGLLTKIIGFAETHQGEYDDVVVIGMGGSSRPGDVIRGTLGSKEGFAQIHVMENLDDDAIANIKNSIDPKRTLFISISKSGGTAETMALTKIAYNWIKDAGVDPAKHFIAITTTSKDSALMQFLKKNNVSDENIFEHPDQVGGRYTLFSVIGMLPAALAGQDVNQILSYARAAMQSQVKYQLGEFLAKMESEGKPYMRVVLPDELQSLGPWIEQLLAESLGKVDSTGRNRGIIPVLERDYDSSIYGDNSFCFRIKLGSSDQKDAFMQQVKSSGVSVWEMQVNSPEEAIGSLYLLEFATGMAGVLAGTDPFNQPGVEQGKQATRDMKNTIYTKVENGQTLDDAYKEVSDSYKTPYRKEIAPGVTLDFGALIEASKGEFLEFVKGKDRSIADIDAVGLYSLALEFAKSKGKSYGAILPYAQETPTRAKVWAMGRGVMRMFGLQDLFGIGPVYEHSMRQYLQEGPDLGIPTFILVNDKGDQIIPGDKIEGFTCGMQNALQALGTQKALADAGRYSLRIEIDGPLTESKLDYLRLFFEGVQL